MFSIPSELQTKEANKRVLLSLFVFCGGEGCAVVVVASFLPLVIIMEMCKAPTLRLKAPNKHSITHIMYIEMENVTSNKKEEEANT